jgi:ABC-type transport system involved in cytochrome bd biosynthesis fused ATPase/permease subunit
VIHGKTGTGKSLLLAAIIGEANILKGSVQVPQAPPMHMRGNEDALLEDWIIPSALAYVGQVPWIENTTIKDTVLFGLPYHHERYRQVSFYSYHTV